MYPLLPITTLPPPSTLHCLNSVVNERTPFLKILFRFMFANFFLNAFINGLINNCFQMLNVKIASFSRVKCIKLVKKGLDD